MDPRGASVGAQDRPGAALRDDPRRAVRRAASPAGRRPAAAGRHRASRVRAGGGRGGARGGGGAPVQAASGAGRRNSRAVRRSAPAPAGGRGLRTGAGRHPRTEPGPRSRRPPHAPADAVSRRDVPGLRAAGRGLRADRRARGAGVGARAGAAPPGAAGGGDRRRPGVRSRWPVAGGLRSAGAPARPCPARRRGDVFVAGGRVPGTARGPAAGYRGDTGSGGVRTDRAARGPGCAARAAVLHLERPRGRAAGRRPAGEAAARRRTVGGRVSAAAAVSVSGPPSVCLGGGALRGERHPPAGLRAFRGGARPGAVVRILGVRAPPHRRAASIAALQVHRRRPGPRPVGDPGSRPGAPRDAVHGRRRRAGRGRDREPAPPVGGPVERSGRPRAPGPRRPGGAGGGGGGRRAGGVDPARPRERPDRLSAAVRRWAPRAGPRRRGDGVARVAGARRGARHPAGLAGRPCPPR